jgi:hypothetical protein
LGKEQTTTTAATAVGVGGLILSKVILILSNEYH